MKLTEYIKKRAADDAAAEKAKTEAQAEFENVVTELETETGINGQ